MSRFDAFVPTTPRAYLEFFLPLVGSAVPLADPLPPSLEQGARAAMAERSPDQAVVPLDELAAAPFPKLVVSGGHHRCVRRGLRRARGAAGRGARGAAGRRTLAAARAGLQRDARGVHRARGVTATFWRDAGTGSDEGEVGAHRSRCGRRSLRGCARRSRSNRGRRCRHPHRAGAARPRDVHRQGRRSLPRRDALASRRHTRVLRAPDRRRDDCRLVAPASGPRGSPGAVAA